MPGFDGMKLVDRLRKRADHADNACQFGDASDMRDAATEIELSWQDYSQLLFPTLAKSACRSGGPARWVISPEAVISNKVLRMEDGQSNRSAPGQ